MKTATRRVLGGVGLGLAAAMLAGCGATAAAMLAGCGATAAAMLAGCGATAEELPSYGAAPSFALTDQHGQPFGSADIGQRAALVSFVFTTCTEWCPVLSPKLRETQEQLRADGLLGSKVLLLSITVDPEQDTPDKLAAYAQRYAADPRHWRFLTGPPEEIQRVVVGGFRVGLLQPAPTARDSAAVPLTITHSNRFVVVDGAGQIRSYLRGEEVMPAEIVRTVRQVVA